MLKKIAIVLLVLTIIGAIAQMIVLGRMLPAEVPIHFDATGQPDHWAGRAEFILLNCGMHFMGLILLPAVGFLIRFIPDSLINMPNKDYWLTKPRRKESVDVIAAIMILIGAVTSWLFMGLFHLSSMVGLGVRDTISPEFIWILVAYLIFIAASCAWVFYRFRAPGVPTERFGPTA